MICLTRTPHLIQITFSCVVSALMGLDPCGYGRPKLDWNLRSKTAFKDRPAQAAALLKVDDPPCHTSDPEP